MDKKAFEMMRGFYLVELARIFVFKERQVLTALILSLDDGFKRSGDSNKVAGFKLMEFDAVLIKPEMETPFIKKPDIRIKTMEFFKKGGGDDLRVDEMRIEVNKVSFQVSDAGNI